MAAWEALLQAVGHPPSRLATGTQRINGLEPLGNEVGELRCSISQFSFHTRTHNKEHQLNGSGGNVCFIPDSGRAASPHKESA